MRKGEKGTRIEFWKPIEPKPRAAGRENEELTEESAPRFHLIRTYKVFNAEQIERLPQLEHGAPKQCQVSERAERL